jgi:predicted DCC family thiol-disulfide oxidoreductase YuxK
MLGAAGGIEPANLAVREFKVPSNGWDRAGGSALDELAGPGSLEDELGGRVLVIFDGNCGLCNRYVRWLLKRDRRDRLRFAASTSAAVAELLARHGVTAEIGPDTVMVARHVGEANEDLLVRSNAALASLKALPQPWPAIAAGLRLIPRPIRESGYRWVARNRYRIWGRHETCPIPTVEEREHFL